MTSTNLQLESLHRELQSISPMPDDPALNVDLLKRYQMIVEEIAKFKDPSSIEPLLDSLGYGTGFEIYWLTIHLLETFDQELLFAKLCRAVERGQKGTKMWAAYMIGRCRRVEGVRFLRLAAHEPAESVRANAAIALGMIGGSEAVEILKDLVADPSVIVRSAAEKALQKLAS